MGVLSLVAVPGIARPDSSGTAPGAKCAEGDPGLPPTMSELGYSVVIPTKLDGDSPLSSFSSEPSGSCTTGISVARAFLAEAVAHVLVEDGVS